MVSVGSGGNLHGERICRYGGNKLFPETSLCKSLTKRRRVHLLPIINDPFYVCTCVLELLQKHCRPISRCLPFLSGLPSSCFKCADGVWLWDYNVEAVQSTGRHGPRTQLCAAHQAYPLLQSGEHSLLWNVFTVLTGNSHCRRMKRLRPHFDQRLTTRRQVHFFGGHQRSIPCMCMLVVVGLWALDALQMITLLVYCAFNIPQNCKKIPSG